MSTIFKNTPTNRDFNNPTGNEIAIIAGTPTYNAAEIDSQLCIYIKEAEFNAVAGSIVVSSIINSFTNCLNAGLKLFLYNGTLIDANNQTAFVNRYKEFPSLEDGFLIMTPVFLVSLITKDFLVHIRLLPTQILFILFILHCRLNGTVKISNLSPTISQPSNPISNPLFGHSYIFLIFPHKGFHEKSV